MIDREKVIRAVDSCFEDWLERHRYFLHPSDLEKVRQTKADALVLLKEQESKLITTKVRKVLWDETDDGPVYNMDTFYCCPKCGYVLSRTNKNKDIHFCSKCGQAVKWE